MTQQIDLVRTDTPVARPTLTLVAVALATFMTYLDNNVVNVAMPAIQKDLHVSIAGLEWVVSSYILVFASLLLAGGRLADVFGRKRLFWSASLSSRRPRSPPDSRAT